MGIGDGWKRPSRAPGKNPSEEWGISLAYFNLFSLKITPKSYLNPF
jgi:hypothetical protein